MTSVRFLLTHKTDFSIVKSLGHILFTILVLISTSGVGITKHLCKGHVSSVSAFGDKGCACGSMEDVSGCCSSERTFVQVDDDFTVCDIQKLGPGTTWVMSALVYHVFMDFDEVEKSADHVAYKQPIRYKDIPVLIQSFLI